MIPWPRRPRLHFAVRDLFFAWLAATVFSGAPSTAYALATGTDPMEATRAAGTMLVSPDAGPVRLFAAAALVHSTVSLFWALVFGSVLPHRHVVAWAMGGSAAVALLDLRVIGHHGEIGMRPVGALGREGKARLRPEDTEVRIRGARRQLQPRLSRLRLE